MGLSVPQPNCCIKFFATVLGDKAACCITVVVFLLVATYTQQYWLSAIERLYYRRHSMSPTSTATNLTVVIDWAVEHDPTRALRLADLLFSPSTGFSGGGR